MRNRLEGTGEEGDEGTLMIKIGICDDDSVWISQAEKCLKEYAEQTGLEAEIVLFSSGEELLAYETMLDVVFMDIVLDGEDGITMAEKINRRWEKCLIVYMTNYLFYATDVYRTEHIFFVLKDEFAGRLKEVFPKIMHTWKQIRRKLVFRSCERSSIVLQQEDIYYFERDKRVTRVMTKDGIYQIWEKLSEIEEMVSEIDFVRCHNSYLVYLPAVQEMLKNSFVLKNGEEVLISRGYIKSVREAFVRWALLQMS